VGHRKETKSPVARFVRSLIYGPEPIGAEDVAALQGYHARDWGHTAGSTIAHYGMRGDPALTFAGYVTSPQEFIGQAQMGSNRALSVQEYPALPNDSPPPALPAVQALLDPFGQEDF
jgi:hypothetical protein